MNKITLIGDVHGKIVDYQRIVYNNNYTIQVGDLGFDYTFLENVDSDRHKIIPGNHDNYTTMSKYSHFLNGFGMSSLNGINFFFLRGSFSIDMNYRFGEFLEGGKKTYWDEEELSTDQLIEAFKLYKRMAPDIVITHDAPKQFTTKQKNISAFGFSNRFMNKTAQCLTHMFDYHKPKYWIHGHHHDNLNRMVDGTRAICLGELKTYDLEI